MQRPTASFKVRSKLDQSICSGGSYTNPTASGWFRQQYCGYICNGAQANRSYDTRFITALLNACCHVGERELAFRRCLRVEATDHAIAARLADRGQEQLASGGFRQMLLLAAAKARQSDVRNVRLPARQLKICVFRPTMPNIATPRPFARKAGRQGRSSCHYVQAVATPMHPA